ncbi:MAG: hydrogenase iron-sulfur subunit [Candidatus Schekmanbacteria bacterium]|nr:MAG: hydrogenase iron-sulfur subunit [Candidatus Schekmanbacteria bacterium]
MNKKAGKEDFVKEPTTEEKELALFICTCADEISKTIDIEKIVESIQTDNTFKSVVIHNALCQKEGIKFIADKVKSEFIEKFVISACSPQSIGKIFKEGLERAGISRNFYEIVNLREGCAWPHSDDPKNATRKALAMIKTAARSIEASEENRKESRQISNEAVVIGAGPAGIAASFELAEAGIKTILLEKKHFLGGMAMKLGIVAPTNDCGLCTAFLDVENLEVCRKCLYRSRIDNQPNLKILTGTNITGIKGEPGNFQISAEVEPRYVDVERCILCGKCEEVCPVDGIKRKHYSTVSRKAAYLPWPQAIPRAYLIDRENCREGCRECEDICPTKAINLNDTKRNELFNAGAVVIATGISEFKPNAVTEYGFGRYQNVITQHELGHLLNPEGHTEGKLIRPSDGKEAKNIVMIQCVGSRDSNYNEYCSEVCCLFAIKHAILIKEKTDAEVTICYIDIRTPGNFEKYYIEARDKWVNFVKGRPSRIEEIPETANLLVEVEDITMNRDLLLEADLVVLSSALRPAKGTDKLSEVSCLDLNEYGFIREYYGKNRATETSLKGIYAAGSVTGPKNIPLSIAQGSAAAAKAISQIKKQKAVKEIMCAKIDEELCIKCGICVNVCPVRAVETKEEFTAIDILETPEVNPVKCVNCGQCSAFCPTGAIWAGNYREENFISQIEEIIRSADIKPKILTFLCLECAYAAVDLVGLKKIKYPPNILPLGVPCAGKVSLFDIFKSFECGADGVIVGGCATCHFKNGKDYMVSQVEFGKKLLDSIGIEKERLEYFTTAISDQRKFLDIAKRMTEKVKALS